MAKIILSLLLVALAFGSFIECRSLPRMMGMKKSSLQDERDIEIQEYSRDIDDNDIKLMRPRRSGSGKARRIPGDFVLHGKPKDPKEILEMINKSVNDGALCDVEGAPSNVKVSCSSKFKVIWSPVDDGTANIKFYPSGNEEINVL